MGRGDLISPPTMGWAPEHLLQFRFVSLVFNSNFLKNNHSLTEIKLTAHKFFNLRVWPIVMRRLLSYEKHLATSTGCLCNAPAQCSKVLPKDCDAYKSLCSAWSCSNDYIRCKKTTKTMLNE